MNKKSGAATVGPTAALFFTLAASALPGAPRDWENPAVFERGQEEPHAALMPFSSVEEVLTKPRKSSAFHRSLAGTWEFHWAPIPEEAPADFFHPDYDTSHWDDIVVPGTWQTQGFGHPLFRNVQQPFPSRPPRVPSHYNPVGSYRREFTIPEEWRGRRIFLHFEGVKSASEVWINGKEVGYNQGGMEPAEYDVTPLLRPGSNTIAVRVFRYSDGTYLEDQDMWRLAGIYRDVYLMATPPVHVRDFFVTTDLDDRYRDAVLTVSAELQPYGRAKPGEYTLRARLFDAQKASVLSRPLVREGIRLNPSPPGTTTVTLCRKVEAPKKWSAEHPNLYTLTLELLDSQGTVLEALGTRIGFREVEVRNQAILVNGVPVKFNGVNSHVHHPMTGRTMDVETMRKDLTLMKQFNINCVRTSHYPPNVEYLDLADTLGMYIIDETGDEAHSTIHLSENPAWRAAYLDRARKMVKRDRNHPCVVIWSAGNESGSGENIAALIAEGKRLDPSRPAWLYGGNTDLLPFEDIVGPRYPHPDALAKVGQVPADRDPRPSFMDEYLAATGNSLGHLEEYWELIYRYPRLTGGAIWDWVSPGMKHEVVATPDASPHHNLAVLMGRPRLVVGRFGNALALSGHDEWVELYRHPSLDITGKGLTLETWIYPRRFHGTAPIITKGDHQFGLLQIAEKELEFFIHDGQRIGVRAPTPPDWQDHWHHLAGIYDGSALRLCCDGKVLTGRNHSGDIDHCPFPVNIGRNAELHGQEHPGELLGAVVDNVRIYPRALSLEELATPTPKLAEEAVLRLDFDEVQERGKFFTLGIGGRSYGLVWPDRRVQPELWQLKKTPQPVKVEPVDLSTGEVRITNRHDFKNLGELNATWKLTGDDEVLQQGALDLRTPAGQSEEVTIPLEKPEPAPGVEYRLLVSFSLAGDTAWAEKGHEVAWEQFALPFHAPARPVAASADLQLRETNGEFVVSGKQTTYTFDKTRGALSSIRFRGKELLAEGPKLNAWRAPTANEMERQWGGAPIVNQWRAAGLDRLRTEVKRTGARTVDRGVEIEAETFVSAPGSTSGFESNFRYRFLGSGEVLIEHRVRCVGKMPQWLPKIGLQMTLPGSFRRFHWYGRGPFETYPDRKTGAKVGIYSGTVDEQYVPYLIPQDHGNKTDVRWASLCDATGDGLLVVGESQLNVSVHAFSTDNLSRALYPFQLVRQEGVTLNIDHRVSGVGGTPIRTLKKYRILPGEFAYAIRLRPFSGGLGWQVSRASPGPRREGRSDRPKGWRSPAGRRPCESPAMSDSPSRPTESPGVLLQRVARTVPGGIGPPRQ